MLLRGSLVTKEVAVRTGIEIGPVRSVVLFAYGQGDGAVRIFLLDRTHYRAYPFIGITVVFPSLEHEGPESQAVSFTDQLHDGFRSQTVAPEGDVAGPYAAIIAVVPAMVGELDQAPYEYFPAVPFQPPGYGGFSEKGGILKPDQELQFRIGSIPGAVQPVHRFTDHILSSNAVARI